MSFPLYGWYFNGELPPNGLPPTQIGNIDQLNAVIAEQLNSIKSIKGGGSGGGNTGGH